MAERNKNSNNNNNNRGIISIIDIIDLPPLDTKSSPTKIIERTPSTTTVTVTKSSGKKRSNSNFKLKLSERKKSFLSWYSGSDLLHRNQVSDTFGPMRVILQMMGRFPFNPISRPTIRKDSSTVTDDYTRQQEQQQQQQPLPYKENLLTFHWLYFLATSSLFLIIFVLISFGFAKFYLGWELWKSIDYEFCDREKTLFNQNLVPFVLFWSCLFHSNVGSVSYVRNRKAIVSYLNEWEIFLRDLKLVLPPSLKTFLIVSNVWFLGFLIMVVLFYAFEFFPMAVGGAELIGILCLKPFDRYIYDSSWFEQISIVSLIILVYSMYSSRTLLFIYAYKCRLLRFGFKAWNRRLKDFLSTTSPNNNTRGDGDGDEEGDVGGDEDLEDEERRTCERLYREHYRLTAMIKRTDKIFGGVLQSYYACQILNMCFELYFLAKSGASETHDPPDVILGAILLLLQNISIFFTVSLDAAYVQDEAHKGLEILRKRGILPRDSLQVKYLMANLSSSYSQRITMTGGKFFAIDRPFIITVLGAVCTYFVIVLQYVDKYATISTGTANDNEKDNDDKRNTTANLDCSPGPVSTYTL